MKKKLISAIMSSFMFISMFSTGYSDKVQAITLNNDDYSQFETGLIPEDKAGQEWLDQNVINVDSEEKLDEIVKSNDESTNKLPKATPKEESIPSSVDNSASKYFPPIVDQIGGSCASYSIGYYLMTYEYNRYHNTTPTEDKNIMSPRWCYNLANKGEDNGSGVSNIFSILKRNGIANIKDVPMSYIGSFPSNYHYDYYARDDIYENALKNRISNSYSVKIGDKDDDTPITSPNDSDLELLKYTLAKGSILTFSTYFLSFKYSTIPEGYAHAGDSIVTSCNSRLGYHEMTIVGYDDNIWVDIDGDNEVDEGEKGAIKIANSWGSEYGNSGFVWVSYDALNYKSSVTSNNATNRIGVLENYVSYGVTMEDTTKNDEFYLELNLNTTLRNTVSVSFNSVSEDKNTTIITPIFDEYGGSYGYDGTTNGTDGKFIIDLSEYNDIFTKEMILKDGIKINIADEKSDGVYLTVNDVALVDRSNNTRTSLLDSSVKLDGTSIDLLSKECTVNAPTNFKVNINEDNHAELSWDKPQDNISYYQIYKDNEFIGTTTDTAFMDNADLNGKYGYSVRAIDNEGIPSKRVSQNVNNTYCKIYYKNNNYNSAYIHFRVNTNTWTTAPGKQMSKSTNKEGYYEYKIDLSEYSDDSTVEACFNNGSGSWDNNNRNNYSFSKGTYTLENGTINQQYDELKINDICIDRNSPIRLGQSVKIYPYITGGSGKYRIDISIDGDNNFSHSYIGVNTLVWTPEKIGKYTISCSVLDKVTGESAKFDGIEYNVKNKEDFKITSIDFDKESPQVRNSKIEFTVNTNMDNVDNNDLYYDVSVIKPDGDKSYLFSVGTEKNKFCYNFAEQVGVYTFNVKVTNKTSGEEVNKTFTYEIENGQLIIKSFKAQKNYYSDEDLSEVKASDYYYLRPYVVGGVGKYTYQYGYYLNNKYYAVEDNTWNSLYPSIETPGEYKFMVVVKDEDGNSTAAYKKITVTQGDLSVQYPEVDKTTVELNDFVNLKFKSKYSLGEVQYKVTDNYNGNAEVIQDFAYGDTFKYKATKGGYHTLNIEGKDSRGIVSSITMSIIVKTDPIVIETFEAKKDTIELGESFVFNIKLSGGYGDKHYYLSAIDENESYSSIETNGSEEVQWKPSKAGKYKIQIGCYDDASNYATKTIEVTVTEPAKLTTTTIYYKGYDNPYIHYRIGNGSWTTAPGVKMSSNSDVDGYNYAITIDLGDAEKLTACFNNGSNSWDSNGGNNYEFSTGYYTYSNGKITEIDKPTKQIKIDSITSKLGSSYVSGNENVFTVQVSNGSGKVQYQFEYKNKTTGVSGVLRNYSEYNTLSTYLGTPGQYTLTVYVKDEAGNTDSKTLDFTIEEYKNLEITSVTSSLGDTFTKGKTTQLTINTTGGKGTNYYSIKVNGESILNESSSNTVSWTPTEAGEYEIIASAREAQGGTTSYTKTITVEDKISNQTTIYYKGYDNPYIHYRIGNGSWTTAPGVKMSSNSDVDGYNYAITLDLGEETSVTACFNNGSNSWDSNGGKNYIFSTGYYTYSNGVITKIEKPSSELKINSITCSSGSTMKMGSKVDLTVNASGGEGPYTYYLYYYGYGSGRLNYIIKEKSYNTATFSPDYPQKTTIYAEVVDSTGKKVKYTQTFDVKDNTSNQTTIYYKGYDNPYIHYKIGNGSWTSAPGVKMEKTSEKEGYSYKITIDLGDADSLTACFNNGNGSWDSNGGKNYTFGVGDYTYSNGKIDKIN